MGAFGSGGGMTMRLDRPAGLEHEGRWECLGRVAEPGDGPIDDGGL